MMPSVRDGVAPRTLGEALERAARLLSPVGAGARRDAEVLVGHACGATRATLVADAGRALAPAAWSTLAPLLERRRRGEPVAYLTGRREFWSLELRVTPATLVPRPETELLVERALARLAPDDVRPVVDLGTGSGAVALALARERPRLRILATDASAQALAVARDNAARLAIPNVEFRLGDWFAPLAGLRCGAIVSNPPYVRSDDPLLRRGELRFEPRTALDGGPDGLDAIRRLIEGAPAHLAPGGWLLLEHGFDQGAAVRSLLEAHGYGAVRTWHDLAGRERVTEGARP